MVSYNSHPQILSSLHSSMQILGQWGVNSIYSIEYFQNHRMELQSAVLSHSSLNNLSSSWTNYLLTSCLFPKGYYTYSFSYLSKHIHSSCTAKWKQNIYTWEIIAMSWNMLKTRFSTNYLFNSVFLHSITCSSFVLKLNFVPFAANHSIVYSIWTNGKF